MQHHKNFTMNNQKINNLINKYIIISSNFMLRIVSNFYNTSGTTRAGSLSFTMLLSFIPFTISMAGLFAAITKWTPFSSHYIYKVEKYFFTNYIPHSGILIYQQVKIFLQQSQNLSILGFSSLLVTTYLMLYAIENQLNALWSAKSKFSILKSLFVHSIFLLSGFTVVIGISVLSIYSHVFLQSETINFLVDRSLTSLVAILLFTLCYKIMPNHQIKTSHALIAGISATLIFSLIKRLFMVYTKYIFINYHIIYGSLAFIPIFLIWIYISCLNFLFCAEIIYGLESKFNRNLQLTLRKYIKMIQTISK